MIAACLAAASTGAAALGIGTPREGYLYFHRVGADPAAHNAAIEACATTAANAIGPGTVHMGGFLAEILADSEESSLAHVTFVANVENCMVVRGWEVVKLDDAEGKSIAALDQAGQAAALARWVGAAAVHGEVLRRYEPIAEAGLGGPQFGDRAKDTLSFTSDKSNILAQTATAAHAIPRRPDRVIEASADPAKIPPDSAVIVVRALTLAPAQAWFDFVLFDPPSQDSAAQQGPVLFGIQSPTKFLWRRGTFLEKTFVFAVPPGHWRLASMLTTSFCLGAPAFNVQPGEAVFAGSFDATHPYAPDMSLEPIKASLGDTPLVQRLHPAKYANGETFDCQKFSGSNLYVLELPDVPFSPGTHSVAEAK